MSCEVIGKTCKLPAERIALRIPLTGAGFFRYREAGKYYAAGVFVRPPKANGYEYEVTTPGQTGKGAPEFPVTPGETVQDGSAVLTCRTLSNNSLVRVPQSASWSVTPSGPTFSGEQLVNTNGEGEAACYLAGGSQGTTYQVKGAITFDDTTIEEGIIEVMVD